LRVGRTWSVAQAVPDAVTPRQPPQSLAPQDSCAAWRPSQARCLGPAGGGHACCASSGGAAAGGIEFKCVCLVKSQF
jgi:hypothetical protein